MLRVLWRRFMAERVTRSIEARISPNIEAKSKHAILASEERLTDAMAALEAVHRNEIAQIETDRQREVSSLLEAYRSGVLELQAAHQTQIAALLDAHQADIARVVAQFHGQYTAERPWDQTLFLPELGIAAAHEGEYMAYSTCCSGDFFHQEFLDCCNDLVIPKNFHRKVWEWAFIVHHLRRMGAVQAGNRGIVFGVGTEPLPSLFAKLGASIVATDAPEEIGVTAGWAETDQYARDASANFRASILERDKFDALVSYRTCDMNNIDPELSGFDFCWSSCCFEHLGSLQAGIDFVINSVEKTLKIGGVACHTTEFNLTSNSDTIETGVTVLYRLQDMHRLIDALRERGHSVDDLKVAPNVSPLDYYVDVPPYLHRPHLKLKLMDYTATSIGIVIRRGR